MAALVMTRTTIVHEESDKTYAAATSAAAATAGTASAVALATM
jgi:hypothetical protein